jgi:hypothetical protein
MSFFKAAPYLPDTLFAVFHHYAIPQGPAIDSRVAFHTVSLGTYSSFFTAQAVAVSALEVSLATLRSAGFKGRVSLIWRRLCVADRKCLVISTNSKPLL